MFLALIGILSHFLLDVEKLVILMNFNYLTLGTKKMIMSKRRNFSLIIAFSLMFFMFFTVYVFRVVLPEMCDQQCK